MFQDNNYPFYDGDSKVVLTYRGSANKVEFLSDLTGWTAPINFIKNDTDLFHLKLELEPDARIQYLLLVDGNPIVDPSNKYQSLHGLGAMSELAMPLYERHPYFDGFLFGEEGDFNDLKKHMLPSGVLPYGHEVYVWLPPNYDVKVDYPVVYFHDGPDYIRFGLAAYTINRLIAENKIKPCIAVFVTPPNLHKEYEPNRSTEYGLNDDYVSFFCDELVPFIDANYRTIKSSLNRFIVGDSYAGLISFYIAFTRNDIFANVYSQSGYFSFRNNKMIDMVRRTEPKPINLLLDVGTYENKVGADFLPISELDFTKANQEMRDVLSLKDYSFVYNEYHEGHTWGNWRRHLIEGIIYFLGHKGVKK